MEAHHATVPVVANQGAVHGPQWGLCADPNSQKKFPNLPNCTLANSTQYWQYYYPMPPGYPGPDDRRVPIDAVTGPGSEPQNEYDTNNNAHRQQQRGQGAFTPEQLLYPHQAGVAGRHMSRLR